MSIRLVPFGPEHDAAFLEIIRDPLIRRFTPAPDVVPDGYAEQWRGRFDDNDRVAFAALDDDGAMVGYAVTPELDRTTGTAELGYAVGPAYRGRGVGTAMLEQLTAWVFAEGVVRAYLLIDPENIASQRVAERAGYRLDGQRDDMQSWTRLPT